MQRLFYDAEASLLCRGFSALSRLFYFVEALFYFFEASLLC